MLLTTILYWFCTDCRPFSATSSACRTVSHPKSASCRTEISRIKSVFMATIRTRRCKNGSLAYLTEFRVKRDGEIVHRESRTFDRRAQANAWAESREKKFARESPTAKRPQRVKQTTLRHVLRRYREEVSEVRPMGRSKTSHIRFLEKRDIARMTVGPEYSCRLILLQVHGA